MLLFQYFNDVFNKLIMNRILGKHLGAGTFRRKKNRKYLGVKPEYLDGRHFSIYIASIGAI